MRIFLICCLSLAVINSTAGVFDGLRSLPASERIAKAQEIYNQQVKRKDSVSSIAGLNELIDIANGLKDEPLQCFSVSLLADQYARMRGLNSLSTELHQEAIRMAEHSGLPLMKGVCNYRLGRYYYNFKKYPFAFEYMLRADNIFRELGYKEVPDIDEILFFIGSIYYETGDYDKAETFLQRAQQLTKINPYVQKQSLNTLALIYRQQGDTSSALSYFQKTLNAALEQNDPAWKGICYTNIGTIFFYQEKYDKAYPLLREGYALCAARKLWEDANRSLLLMARIDLMQNQIKPARRKIDSAIATQRFFFTLIGRRQLYEAQVLFYEKTGQQAKALKAQHLLLLVKDSLSFSKDQQAYKKILLRMETEKHLNDIDKLEASAKAAGIQRNGIIVALALLVIVLFLLYNRNRLKAKNHSAILQAEKLRAEERLKSARQQLKNFTENARRKNELIEQFAAELQRLKGNLTGEPLYEERLKNFDKLIHSSLLTDAEWNGFRELFDKVHKGFFSRLEQKLPGLSVNDTRLVSLVKLELGNHEMARMMGMHADDIARAKQRLRDKIHPGPDGLALEDLVQAI